MSFLHFKYFPNSNTTNKSLSKRQDWPITPKVNHRQQSGFTSSHASFANTFFPQLASAGLGWSVSRGQTGWLREKPSPMALRRACSSMINGGFCRRTEVWHRGTWSFWEGLKKRENEKHKQFFYGNLRASRNLRLWRVIIFGTGPGRPC